MDKWQRLAEEEQQWQQAAAAAAAQQAAAQQAAAQQAAAQQQAAMQQQAAAQQQAAMHHAALQQMAAQNSAYCPTAASSSQAWFNPCGQIAQQQARPLAPQQPVEHVPVQEGEVHLVRQIMETLRNDGFPTARARANGGGKRSSYRSEKRSVDPRRVAWFLRNRALKEQRRQEKAWSAQQWGRSRSWHGWKARPSWYGDDWAWEDSDGENDEEDEENWKDWDWSWNQQNDWQDWQDLHSHDWHDQGDGSRPGTGPATAAA
eukprot:symbB.v1.2.019366.t1/scaffold1582.1/size178113/1